jgi:Plasma-membrane choline transporter
MTYSFGSISFGSLIVSVIQFIKQLASVGRAAAQQEGDTIFQIIFCCLQCLAGIIQGLVQYFNHYAYTQIALFGKVLPVLTSVHVVEISRCCERYLENDQRSGIRGYYQ